MVIFPHMRDMPNLPRSGETARFTETHRVTRRAGGVFHNLLTSGAALIMTAGLSHMSQLAHVIRQDTRN